MLLLVALWVPRHVVLNASNVTIVSIGEHGLIVSRTLSGKTERLRFTMTTDTVRPANLAVGARVAVHYVVRNHEKIATSVQSLVVP
jgi:hypothetical protein